MLAKQRVALFFLFQPPCPFTGMLLPAAHIMAELKKNLMAARVETIKPDGRQTLINYG
ncbi:hypothetical protein ABC733_15135 [Mangrovibacter sp. SLW1]